MKQQRPFPQVVVTRKAARALQAGHPWVFEGEVLRVDPAPLGGQPAVNGDVVDVVEANGTYQGTGLLSLKSKIRVRIVSRNANDRFDAAFWERKLAWAWEYRRQTMGPRSLPGCPSDLRACRVLFSEADGFPGLIIDRYEDVLVSQVGTFGMERLKAVIYPLLLNVMDAAGEEIHGIYERNDSSIRDKEGLVRGKGWWRPVDNDEYKGITEQRGQVADPLARIVGEPAELQIVENGIRYALDLEHSQKTGYFLDQKYNRRAVRRLAGGKRVLDAFCHVGSFGLNAAAGGAAFVRCVDVSETACELARGNAELNGFELVEGPMLASDRPTGKVGVTCANVMEYLPHLRENRDMLREEGGPFDLIVLDPPAFTKSRTTTENAARGYKQVNLEALRLLPRGGYLATCSCSHFMPAARLAQVVAEAAHDAGVQVRQVEERQQAPDHPILYGVPETDYLKFFIFQVV